MAARNRSVAVLDLQFLHGQILRTKGNRQQLVHCHPHVRAISLSQVHLPIRAKLSHELSTTPTGRDELLAQITGDDNGPEGPAALRHGFSNGVPLSALAQVITSILHIATSEYPVVLGQQRRPHSEFTVGTVGSSLHNAGFKYQLSQNVLR